MDNPIFLCLLKNIGYGVGGFKSLKQQILQLTAISLFSDFSKDKKLPPLHKCYGVEHLVEVFLSI